jgi:hypothetical protein
MLTAWGPLQFAVMPKLDDQHKQFIVQALACFDSPTQVSRAVKEEFGIDVPKEQVQQYNPTRAAAKWLGKKWRALFEETRKRFLDDVAAIPVANQSYRLRSLQRLHDQAVERKNAQLAAQLLEQAAKEVGGAYTNRRELQGPGGGPIPVQHGGKVEHLHAMADADLEAIARGEAVPGAGSGGA